MPKCIIQWVDPDRAIYNPTPDDNEAIGEVMCEAYTYTMADGYKMNVPATKWMPICAEHVKRLQDRDVKHWIFRPYVQGKEGNKS